MIKTTWTIVWYFISKKTAPCVSTEIWDFRTFRQSGDSARTWFFFSFCVVRVNWTHDPRVLRWTLTTRLLRQLLFAFPVTSHGVSVCLCKLITSSLFFTLKRQGKLWWNLVWRLPKLKASPISLIISENNYKVNRFFEKINLLSVPTLCTRYTVPPGPK